MSILIFSQPVHSGKTSALQLWCREQENISGLLMPDINGKRKILDIRSGAVLDLECEDPDNCREEWVQIGRFRFHQQAFRIANAVLLEALKADPTWLVIDEVGKLEMEGRGFYQPVKIITETHTQKAATGNLLLVVRESLYTAVVGFFNIGEHRLINRLSEIS